MKKIDTTNHFLVGVRGDGLIVVNQPVGVISRERALNLAAWLVALADRDDKFEKLLEAVRNT